MFQNFENRAFGNSDVCWFILGTFSRKTHFLMAKTRVFLVCFGIFINKKTLIVASKSVLCSRLLRHPNLWSSVQKRPKTTKNARNKRDFLQYLLLKSLRFSSIIEV